MKTSHTNRSTKKIRIFAVASVGGHWIELLRILKYLNAQAEIIFLSTHPKCATMVNEYPFFVLKDFNRWNFYRIIPVFINCIKLILSQSPDIIISTGAAPGLICLLAGKILGKKTIWIDTIASTTHLSLSGKIASRFASRTYTQWKNLSNKHIYFAGNVFGD